MFAESSKLMAQSGRHHAIDEHCFAIHAKSLQKSLAMLRDSELKCGLFGCSIKRSITELNSDSHSRRFAANSQEAPGTQTGGSCGNASPPEYASAGSKQICFGRNLRPDHLRTGRTRPVALACGKPRTHRAEFISVSGQRTDRSALRSDMRHSKRISGHAAATVPPHAPMNRSARRNSDGRVCLLTIVN
jgi:hypothetical protein